MTVPASVNLSNMATLNQTKMLDMSVQNLKLLQRYESIARASFSRNGIR